MFLVPLTYACTAYSGEAVAHTSSAEKRHRQSLKRRERNRSVRTLTRTAVSEALAALQTTPATAGEAVRRAMGVLDRAAKKGVIHANNAARHKSRLMARYNAALALASAPVSEAATAAAPRRRRAATAAKAAPQRPRAAPKAKAEAVPAKPARAEKKAPARRGLRLGRKKAE